MRAVLVCFLVEILFVSVLAAVVVGPGQSVAGAEHPFRIGPWDSTGHYRQIIFTLSHRGRVARR